MTNQVAALTRRVRNRAMLTGVGIGPAIQGVLDDHIESLPEVLPDEALLRDQVERNLIGFSFLQPFLDDESIEEIWINRPGEVRFARKGVHDFVRLDFSEDELKTQVERMIRQSGRRLDRSMPFIDAQLPNGFRLHAVIPDITREFLSLNIRKYSKNVLTVGELVAGGMLTENQARFLRERLARGENLLISGATQAGKTTLLSALISSIDTSERVVSVEDTFELRCQLPDWVALQTRPASSEGTNEIDLRKLVRETLRMRPTRLVVGEVRGAEALDMLIAMNSGIPGLCTIHANSADEALKKLQTLPLLAGGNISAEFLKSLIRGSMNLFLHCERRRDGSRRLTSIKEFQSEAELTLLEVSL